MKNEIKECCPEFKPEKWDQKTFNWENKPFLKETMPTFFHIPLSSIINKKVVKMSGMAMESKMAEANPEDALLLFRDPGAFKSEMYLSVAGQVPDANNAAISGTFIGKVFDGPYRSIPKFIKETNDFAAAQGKKPKDYYIHYAYCPKCAKKYGKNWMIIFAEV
jgi:hypothetical protein